jgi:hypothetical protein
MCDKANITRIILIGTPELHITGELHYNGSISDEDIIKMGNAIVELMVRIREQDIKEDSN